jgi:hypothetical protein
LFNLRRHVDEGGAEAVNIEDDDDVGGVSGKEEENEIEEVVEARGKGSTFEEAMNANIDLIAEFAQGLRYQVQFRDQRMLNTLEREGAGFLRLARACTKKEKKHQQRGRRTHDRRKGYSEPNKTYQNGPHGLDMPNFEIMNFTLQRFVGYLLNCGREHETYLTSKRHAADYVFTPVAVSHDVIGQVRADCRTSRIP